MRRFIFRKISSSASYTSDFLTATGITDATIISALTAMEASLTTAGLINYSNPASNKIKVLYPFVGGSASLHKFNFLDPRDLDAAFRLTFYGGWTHSSNGALSNGTNGYADSYFTPSVSLSSANNQGHGMYSGTSGTATGAYGCENSATSKYFETYPAYTDNKIYSGLSDNGTASSTITNNSRAGFIGVSRDGASSKHYNIRGTATNNTEAVTVGLVTSKFYIGAANRDNTTTGTYIAIQYRTAYIDSGFSAAELASMNTILITFNTSLSRT